MPRQYVDPYDPDEAIPGGAPTRRRVNVVLPPKDMHVVRRGDRLKIVLLERGRYADSHSTSGADHYAVFWAEDVDESTLETINAGASRATMIGSVGRSWIENGEITFDVTSAEHQNGFFYVYGQTTLGDRSTGYLFSGRQSNEVLDETIPDDVTYFDATENGVQHQGSTVSRIDWRCITPLSSSFDGVQWVLKDYPNLGDVTRYLVQKFLGTLGGLATGHFTALPCRRAGTGTSISIAGANVAVLGGDLLSQAQAGDILEILGVQATIQSVTDNLNMVLSAAWSGEPISLYTGSWTIIGQVTIYANAVSKAGTHGNYVTAPSKALHFDAEMSPPLQPTLVASSAGNLIRLYATIQGGDEIDAAILFRGTGSGVAFASCSPLKTWAADKIKSSGPTLTHEDTDFTTYQKENGQTFTYYVVAINRRGQQSVPSAAAMADCRLDGGKEGSDPAGKIGVRNLLYNGHVIGTTFNEVLANDTSQDWAYPTDASNLPGVPFGSAAAQAYGTGRYRGYTRWNSDDAGTGAAGICYHNNGTEVGFEPPGAGKGRHLWQEIEAWGSIADVAPAGYRYMRIKRGGIYTLAWKMLRGGGLQPNGHMLVILEQYDLDTQTGKCERRYRDSTDALLWTTDDYTISGADVLTDWQLYYTTFRLRTDLAGNTAQLRVRFAWIDGTQGEIYLTEVMLCDGEEFGAFTGDLQESCWPPSTGVPPGSIGDGEGRRRDKLPIEP